MDTLNPWLLSKTPSDAAIIPFPKEDTTPPVTKIYLVLFLLTISPLTNKEFVKTSTYFNTYYSLEKQKKHSFTFFI